MNNLRFSIRYLLKRGLISLPLLLLLESCASTESPQLLRMRSLHVAIDLESNDSNGSIGGLESLPRDENGRLNANVLFVHGIGWTQDREKLDFARDFVIAISEAYGVAPPSPNDTSLCPRSSFEKGSGGGTGLRVTHREHSTLYSDYSRYQLGAVDIACLDKQVLDLGESGSITIYRVMWDDTLYDAYEYPMVGYDDFYPRPGFENIDRLRAATNQQLKSNVVTYGLSDAAMYLGPIGSLLRAGISAGICAAIDDASGASSLFNEIATTNHEIRKSAADLCASEAASRSPAFAFVAESLGSRAVYDVLTDPINANSESDNVRTQALKKLYGISNRQLEIYLLANQIPLLGIGRATQTARISSMPKPVKIVAFSEINDLLTFELAPYFEHLFMSACIAAGKSQETCARDLMSRETRLQMEKDLGFEVVDVRVKFARPRHIFLPHFIDPEEAHTKYISSPIVRDLIICGAKDGVLVRRSDNACVE
jgi:hypothetical protein